MARRFYAIAASLAVIGGLGFLLPSPILGVFETTPALNTIHLAAAVVSAFAATRGIGTMRSCGRLLGYVFAALAVAGFVIDAASVGNVVPLSATNAWFHLVMALVLLYHALLAPPVL